MDNYDNELRRRLKILKQMFMDGRIQIPRDKGIEKSLLAIKVHPNGEVNLKTVDGVVRSLAMTVTAAQDRDDAKKYASLREIQEIYFESLSINFGWLYEEMLRRRCTPYQIGEDVSCSHELVDGLYPEIPEFLAWIKDFWDSTRSCGDVHVEDMASLKAVFGGSIYPKEGNDVASSSGIYVDTIILPDPFLRSEVMIKSGSKKEAVQHVVIGALSLLQYRDLALADVSPAIIAVLPDRRLLRQDSFDYLAYKSEKDIISHLGEIFSVNFASMDEVNEFVDPLTEITDVMSMVRERSHLLFDAGSSESIENQFNRHLDQIERFVKCRHAGKGLVYHSIGRMRQANDALLRAHDLGGVPLLDAPTAWRHFQWKLEYDAGRFASEGLRDLHMCKALQTAAEGEMAWLGNVPHKALIEIRKQGALAELRQLLSSGVSELTHTNPTNFYRTSDTVAKNLQDAFDDHRKKLKTLSGKKWRFAGVDLATCVVRGAVEIASACGVPGVSLVNTAINEMFDIPKVRELPDKYRSLKKEDVALEKSPVGLLFRHSIG